MKNIPSEKIFTKKSKIKNAGRGVYAKVDIKKGEIIEKCPMLIIPKGEIKDIVGNTLATYLFSFGKKKENLALALGFGSIYNHSYSPNAAYKIKPKDEIIDFVALEDIKKGSEILINYIHDNPEKNGTLWFEI